MEWLEHIPAPARAALSIGGATVATQANHLPSSWQLIALGLGMSLCAYGIAASMRAMFAGPRRDPDWLEEERKKDFERQQYRLMYKFRHLRKPDDSSEHPTAAV